MGKFYYNCVAKALQVSIIPKIVIQYMTQVEAVFLKKILIVFNFLFCNSHD